MTPRANFLIACAVSFAVAGDYMLKLYGERRATVHLVACLSLWEVCAILWVFAYRLRLPLGRSTALGAALALFLNCILGIVVFKEPFTPQIAIGCGCALVGMFLLA